MEQFSFAIALLSIWLLASVSIVSGMVVLDFLFLGRRGRLDWIANLFRREDDQDK